MKKLFITALAVSLIFSGWQAGAEEIQAPAENYAAAATTKGKKKTPKSTKDSTKTNKDTTKTTKDKKDKKKGKKGEKKAKESPMALVLKDMEFFNGEPNLEAEYYIYLQSASWCGPCNREMPEVVEQYKAMKEDGRVEIILVGHDQTPQKAEGFLKQYGATFPGIMASNPKAASLPGFTKAQGIPNAIIVDSEGKVLYTGHPGRIFHNGSWKNVTINRPDAEP